MSRIAPRSNRRTRAHTQHADARHEHYGNRKDPAKMTYSRMALIERGLGSKQANASEHEEQGTHGRIWHGTQSAQARRWAWGGAAHL